MADYDFTGCLSPIDFELLSKDLLEAELGIKLENFSEGRDMGIDLRYAPLKTTGTRVFNLASKRLSRKPSVLIVQCKRFSKFANLKSELKNKELPKILKLKPARYILTTSVSLSPAQVDELKALLSPFVQATGDIYGRERLNSILMKHKDVERSHLKLWVSSAGVLESIVNAKTHVVSGEEVNRTIAAAKIYVRNESFDEALAILKRYRVCIISGLPGIGKTTLARMLLLYFWGRGFDVVKIESDVSEASAVGYHKRPRFYYYDDFLGQTGQPDKLNKNEDQKLLDFMASVRESKDSVFVLTTREYILNQAKIHYEKLAREKFDDRTCIIDLASYSRRIRAQILYNHLHFSKLPRAHVEALIASRGYIAIVDHENYNPRLIEYLTDTAWIGDVTSTHYLALVLRNLDNPTEIWGHAFRHQLSDKARHLLFVLTTMPVECLISDADKSFTSFHHSQCARFGMQHSAMDFKIAVKELDGTFVATRKVGESVLIRFQNPSIRDFMQHLLLSGELLEDVIKSAVFFEQARWFSETLNDDEPRVSIKELSLHASLIVDALQRLIKAKSCSLPIHGPQGWHHITMREIDPAARLLSLARASPLESEWKNHRWMTSQLYEIAADVEAGRLSPSPCVDSVIKLQELGCLESEAGNCLVSIIKEHALRDPDDLDDFESLAALIVAMPELFSESELGAIRITYREFAGQYADECDLSDPDDLRGEASRISEVAELLCTNADFAEGALRELADKIEQEEVERRIDYDGPTGAVDPIDSTDQELDSMFGTLGA